MSHSSSEKEATTKRISVKNLSKVYNKGTEQAITAIEDVNFSVDGGEFFTVVGPSGCGKTTLIKIIAGLVSQTEGSVEFGGKPIREPQPEIGLVFQESSLYPWRTVIRNIEFGLELRGVEESERRARAKEMIDLVGLSGFKNAYPDELSGGMQQRVALARTLVADPDVLLMDEPFGALDEQTRFVMGEELLRIWSTTDKTVIFITHSLQEAVLLSDRVGVMTNRPGHIDHIIDIDLERPRSTDSIGSEPFQNKQAEIWEIVKREAQQTLDQSV